MTKKLSILLGGITILLIATGSFVFFNQTSPEETLILEQQRENHAKIIANSPFKKTLKWDKKTRKREGLPPNRYFEQMWELTVNPSTGKMEDGNLTLIREELIRSRSSQRNPGEAGNAWEERGPNDIGGRTRAILFDPNDTSNNTVYAGGVSGGLWKNTNITNANSQWQRVQNVPGNLSVTSITVDPNNSNRWYVGTGEQYTAGDVVGNGVYVSNDGGNSWSAVNIPPAGPGTFEFNASNLFLSGIFYVNDIVAWDNNGNTELFVGVGAHVYGDASSPTNWLGLQTAGLYRSTNDGATWNRIESSNLQFDFQGTAYPTIPNDFEIGADGKLWMGTITTPGIGGDGGGRVFSTTNGGTWTEAAASPLTDSNRVELAVSTTNANKMYALTQGVNNPVHVYTTTNGFASISDGALPNDADNGIPANDFCRGQAFYDLMIEVDPNNDNILYVGGIDLFRSTNGANSWTQISKWSNNPGLNTLSAPFVHADQHAMTFRPGNSNQAVFGNDGGIYYASSLSAASGNGNAISVRNNNYNVTQYVKAGIGPNGNGDTLGIFTAGAQDNGSQAFRNGNAAPGINGSEELSDGDGFYTFVDKDGQYMIATFVNNVIYRFNLPWDGRGRRQGGATTLSSDQSRGDFVNPMGYDSDANRLLTNNSNQTQNAIKSINVASNSNGSITNAALTDSPTAFRASPFANNTWYVGLGDGNLVRLTNVTNSNATFTTITTPFVGSVSSIRYGATANDIFVTIHNYGVTSVWATSNGGSSWQNKEGDLPNLPVRDILQNPLNRNEAILATQLGVWSTDNFNDANPNWTQAYNGMSDASVTSFDYWAVNGNDNDNKIIASTYGRGVFTGKFTGSTVADTQNPTAPTNLTASNVTQTSVDLSWIASTDNIGVTSYDILQNGTVIGNTITTNFVVSGLTASTQYSFTVVANDASGNVSSQSNIVNVTTATVISSCSNSISSFPYSESFESGIGTWTQSSSDDIDWTVDSNGTPSNNTGPTSAVDGSNYIYVEASGDGDGFPNRRAILTSPCFDLGGLSDANFSFQYHMFGSADGGSVDLEVSTDEGVSWSSIWNQTGNQGNQWLAVDIDLATYLGDEIQLRFNRITGGTWQSDVAIDNINMTGGVNTPTSCNTSVSSYPYTQGFESGIGTWTQSNSDDIDWTVDSNGTPSNNTGPASAIEGSNYIYVEASGDGDGFPNRRAILTSPCFDLSGLSDANFSFQYHMFGSADGGSVDLEVSTNEGASWTSIWNQTGNQGNQWLAVDVDLSVYVGITIQLRFNRITGGTWQSDVAIDDISLSAAGGGSSTEECDALDFNNYTINSFSNQDNDGANAISNNGASLTLSNNTWKYIDFPYTVTQNTVIELEFSSTSEGEIHGIGFENDNSLTPTFYFKFYGTQNYGITNFDNYTNGTVTYVIPVGDSYTGAMDRLVFVNDNDASAGNNSTFTNIKIYETSCTQTAITTEVVFGERVDILGDEDEIDLKMYPNPVKNILHVEVSGIEKATYKIINMLGQTVLRGSYAKQIEVGTLNDGMYFLELRTGKQSISRKFIKQ